jgi:outer membrane immunogenic protein
MKRLLLSSLTGLILTTGSALAADLYAPAPAPAYKAPPPPPPAVSWTGCYIDGGVGYGMWNEDHYSETFPGLAATSVSTTSGGQGWLGRLGAGCDYQLGSSFVIGAFGDYSFMHLHGTFDDPVGFGAGALAGGANEWGAWAVGGRLGYLITPALLTYVNGGYTEARFGGMSLGLAGAPFTPGVDFTSANTYRGWFLGGGTEYALNFSWLPIRGLFWRNEYRFSDYNAADVPVFATATGLAVGAEHNTIYDQTITSSLIWRFNWH